MNAKLKPVGLRPNGKVHMKRTSVTKVFSEAVDVVSSSSQSSFGEMPSGKSAFDKVNSWLSKSQNGCKKPTHGQGEYSTINSKYSPTNLDYPQQPNKVQTLLRHGEYTIFKKWLVLVEGDFVQIRFNETGKGERVTNISKSAEDNLLKIQSKKKSSLRDIRTIALTKNWLLICDMHRLFQVDKDGVVPAGIYLQLRRLVPLKYIQLQISRPAQRVIAITSQCGLVKEYQLIDRAGADNNEQFMSWKKTIHKVRPNHSDETLLTTLQLYERWRRQHSCRITICAGTVKESDTSLSDWQQKTFKRQAPLPPAKGEEEAARRSRNCSKVSASDTVHTKKLHLKEIFREASVPQLSSRKSENSPKIARKPSAKSPRNNHKTPVASKRTAISLESASTEEESLTPVNKSEQTATATTTGSSNSEVVSGCEASIGASESMTCSHSSTDLVMGVEASVGLNRPMTPDSESGYTDRPGPSTIEKKHKRSVKSVFKMGLFVSKKNKKKSALAPSSRAPEPRASPEPPRPHEIKRRVSRLEMGIPIEEVFSGIKFATLDKKIPQPQISKSDDDDDDVIEIPEPVVDHQQKKELPSPVYELDHDYLSYEGMLCECRDGVLNNRASKNLNGNLT